jgi:hypothetical protein
MEIFGLGLSGCSPMQVIETLQKINQKKSLKKVEWVFTDAGD